MKLHRQCELDEVVWQRTTKTFALEINFWTFFLSKLCFFSLTSVARASHFLWLPTTDDCCVWHSAFARNHIHQSPDQLLRPALNTPEGGVEFINRDENARSGSYRMNAVLSWSQETYVEKRRHGGVIAALAGCRNRCSWTHTTLPHLSPLSLPPTDSQHLTVRKTCRH